MHTKQELNLGKEVLLALEGSTSKFTKEERSSFTKAQAAFEELQDEVVRHENLVTLAKKAVDEADAEQDAATMSLAKELVGDGHPRVNPFAAFDVVPPGRLVDLGVATEARTAIELSKAVLAEARSGPGSKRAAEALVNAAGSVLKAERARKDALAARALAIAARDAQRPAWQLALTKLRAAVKFADGRDGTAEYARIFGSLTKPRVAKKVASSVTTEPVS